MNKFEIYYLNKKYYHYLVDINFLDEMMKKDERPHIGFILLTDWNPGFGYVIPLVTGKFTKSKYQKLIKYKTNGKEEYSILKIDKMIPILNNNDFIRKNNKLTLREKVELVELNNIRDEIINLAKEVRKYRYKFNVNHFKKSKDLNFSIDYPLVDHLAINYFKSLHQHTIDELINNYKNLEVNKKLIERKYFSSDFDHINSLNNIKLANSLGIVELRKRIGDENFNKLIFQNNQLKEKLNKYYLYAKNLNEIENDCLMAFWLQKNNFIDQSDKFNGIEYQVFSYTNKPIQKDILNVSYNKTKFYFENDDLKIWYGWMYKDSNHRKIVIVNKDNNFAVESESIWLELNSGEKEFRLALLKLFKSFPHEFKSIFDKYGYPYNVELFYQRQIDNINQQLERYSKNPQLLPKIENDNSKNVSGNLLDKLNDFKKMREKQLIDIRKDWKIYLESQGLVKSS